MQPETRARLRRVLRRTGWGALIALGAVILLVGIALGALTTSFGGERVRRFVVPKVNQAIAGHLEIGRLRAHVTGIELFDVTLTDPDGAVVAQVARVELAAELRRLLARQVAISRIVIERPDLRLVQSARGLNLSRAIAPRAEAPAPPPEVTAPDESPSTLELELRALEIKDGTVDFRDATGAAQPVRIEHLDVDGKATVALGTQRFDAQLALRAASLRPLAAPLALRVQAAGQGAAARAEVRLGWGDARIDLDLVSRDERTQTVTIGQIVVPADLVRVFVPASPMRASFRTEGKVTRVGERVDVALQLRAADAHGDLRLAADLDPVRPVLSQLQLALADIDLAQLVRGGPPSRFDLKVDGQGAGRDLASAKGELRLTVPPGTLDGRKFGPVLVDARAADAQVALRALNVALPGLMLTATGEGGADRLQAQARIEARDLALTARSLRLPASLGLGGNGRLTLTATGSPAAAKVAVTGRFPALRISGNELEGLDLVASSADVSRAPAGTSVKLKVPRARFGQQIVRDLNLALASVGAEGIRLALTTAAPVRLSLQAAGRTSRAADVNTLDLDSLELAYPEATWRLAQPVRLRVGDRLVSLGKLDLQAAPAQRMQIDLSLRGNRIDANAALSQLDLARLPALAQPPGNKLGGLVDLTLAAAGRLPRPDATVDLRLSRASVAGKLDDVGLVLQARHRGSRVTGKLTASVLHAQPHIDFDLPVVWPPPPATRLYLRGDVAALDLARVAALAEAAAPSPTAPTTRSPPVQGQLTTTFELDGPAADPALSVTARVQQLRWNGERLEDIHMTVEDPIGKPLQVAVRTSILGRSSGVSIDSPVVIGSWLRRPPDNDALLAVPFVAKADIDRLPLAAVSPRTRGKPDVTGSITTKVALTGPVARLRGTVNVAADEVAGYGIPPTSARLVTRLGQGREGLDAQLTVTRQRRTIAQLTAMLGAGVDDLLARRSLDRVSDAKLEIKGHVGPLALQRMVAGAEAGPKKRRPFRALVEANLTGTGTLGDPRVELRLAAQDAQLDRRALGGGRVQLLYRNATPNLNVQLNSAGGGHLSLAATAKVDLSLPALTKGKGIKTHEIPIDAKLSARSFDLAFLSGVQDGIRVVEGQLEAEAQVSGKAGAPQMVGKLAWNGGRLVLAGQGELRDIQLAAHGDPRKMVLDRLFARSGSGSATVTANAVRDAGGRTLAIDARADLNRFRVQNEGQPVGALTLQAQAKGTVAPDKTTITTTIDEARMELADGDRRDLQSLKRPEDVVLLSNGEPLDKTQARRYDALVNRPAPVVPPAATPEAAAAGKAAPTAPTAPASPATAGNAGPASAARPVPASRPADDDGAATRIKIDAPRNLWVRGADMNIEVGLDPDFLIVQGNQTRIFGKVQVKRGFVEVLSRRFDVASGSSVRFTGPPDRPVVSIDATYTLKQAKKSDLKVVVHVEGPADKLSITMSSPGNPQWAEGDLVSMIVTGRRPDEESNSTGFQADTQAKSLVGGLLAARVQKVATAHLPIDVLNIDLNDPNAGARLEAGTYLSDDLYVAYVGRQIADPMGRENRNELHLEYQLTPRWSFEATYGDARRGSVDLLWTRNY